MVWDLGCGDGRIPVTAAREYCCKARGFDIDPARIQDSLANVRKYSVERLVTIEERDIFTLDLSKGPTLVTLYLLPSLNAKLLPQLRKLQPGARVISVAHRMADIKPDAHAIDDLGIDSLDFLDIVFALDKKFGIKIPLERWTQEVNQGNASVEDYFILKNLCARIDELVAAKSA